MKRILILLALGSLVLTPALQAGNAAPASAKSPATCGACCESTKTTKAGGKPTACCAKRSQARSARTDVKGATLLAMR